MFSFFLVLEMDLGMIDYCTTPTQITRSLSFSTRRPRTTANMFFQLTAIVIRTSVVPLSLMLHFSQLCKSCELSSLAREVVRLLHGTIHGSSMANLGVHADKFVVLPLASMVAVRRRYAAALVDCRENPTAVHFGVVPASCERASIFPRVDAESLHLVHVVRAFVRVTIWVLERSQSVAHFPFRQTSVDCAVIPSNCLPQQALSITRMTLMMIMMRTITWCRELLLLL